MLDRIRNHEILQQFVKETCCENNICIDFDDNIQSDDYVILKPDEYYNSLHLGDTPESADCLIVLKCESQTYKLVLVELKNINTNKRFSVEHIVSKFKNCLDDFIATRFEDILYIDYQNIELYFISKIDPFKSDNDALKIKLFFNQFLKYNGKKYYIKPRVPTPVIKKCY
jgi:hypothetical protein